MTQAEKAGAVVVVAATVALTATGLVPATVLVLSLPFLALAARRPVLRRLAVRNAIRRPRETAFVLLGSLLGTAVITGSFVVGDTLDASLRQSAFTQLGPVDMVVSTADDGPDQRAALEGALAGLPTELTDGILPLVTTGAAVATTGAEPRAEPKATVVEVDFDRARAFGGDPATTGIAGPTPGPGEAALGADLAHTLDVGIGDHVELYVYGRALAVEVVRVLPRRGLAGLQFDFGSRSPTLFLHPGTLHAAAGDAAAPGRPPQFLVAVSNRGGVVDGAVLSERVEQAVVEAAAGLATDVVAVKQDVLDLAKQVGGEFTALFAGIGFFSVVAGVILLVNVFVMLAQERKTELGMLRAVGLRRGALVGSFALEGWLYALAAAALGAVAGLAVGAAVVVVAAGMFGDGEFAIDIRYRAELAGVQAGFTIGFVVSMLTVVAASLGIARLNIIRAIRDLPDPPGGAKRSRTSAVMALVAATAGAGLSTAGISGHVPILVLIGPSLAVFGVARLVARRAPVRPVASMAASAVIVWCVVAFELLPPAFRDADVGTFVVQGALLTTAAVVLASRNQDVLASVVGRLGGRAAPCALRLGLAYPMSRRLRTSLILAMYALVVFTLTFITTLGHLFSAQVDDVTQQAAGGFDVRLETSAGNPAGLEAVASAPGVATAAGLATTTAEFEAGPGEEFRAWPVAGFDTALVAGGPVALSKRSAAYADDEAAYRAVLTDPSLVVVDELFLRDGNPGARPAVGPDEQVTVRDPVSGRSRTLTVVGVTDSQVGVPFAYVSLSGLQQLLGSAVVTNTFLVRAHGDVDADRLATGLNARFRVNGADATSFRRVAQDALSQQRRFFRLMEGYLALGLLVGVAGLGVVMVRAVHERRRQIGTLRALGFQPASVRAMFVVESSFVALQGIAIGMVLACVTAWRLTADGGNDGGTFSLPWLSLATLAAGTYGASLLATVLPARQASRIRPTVALRLVD